MSGVRRELMSLHGVGKKRAALMERAGIGGLEDLLRRDLEEIRQELCRREWRVEPSALEHLRFHAQSYRDGRPVLFGSLPDLGDSYLVLDLEYTPLRLIWLVGLLKVDHGSMRHLYLWADDAEAERENLERLAGILRRSQGMPILTWGGRRADLPQLRTAVGRLSLLGLFRGIFTDHVDLLADCQRSLRLPLPGLGLDEVARFFGFEKKSRIANGFAALGIYDRYREEDDEGARAAMRSALITYNREDLEAVVAIEKGLRSLESSSPAALW